MPSRSTAVKAWICYDWGNSAFATSVIATLMPIYFHDVIAQAELPYIRSAIWGYATAISLALTALLSPVLGLLADRLALHKRFVLLLMVVGCTATLALAFTGVGETRLAAGLYIIANFGFVAGNVFYNSLLGSVAAPAEADRISLKGYAFGYLGGGLLLLVHVLLINYHTAFGLESKTAAIRIAIGSVAVWWALFSLPLALWVPQPERARQDAPLAIGREARNRLRSSFKNAPLALPFLVAFWLYGDGIGTIYRMASTFASEIGIDRSGILMAILLVQFLGLPFTYLFLPISRRIGTLNALQLALVIYIVVCGVGYGMRSELQFFVLAGLVAIAQGPAQALSRSFFSSIIDPKSAGLMFGFYAVTDKFAGIFGPLIFALVAQSFGTSRMSILVLAGLFGAGIIGLQRVKRRMSATASQAS